MSENIKIGLRIKELRQSQNITQQELANKLGYKSRSTINKIELGINELHPTKLFAFANALNTTPQYIMGWDKSNIKWDNEVIVYGPNGTTKYYLSDNEVEQVLEFLRKLKQ